MRVVRYDKLVNLIKNNYRGYRYDIATSNTCLNSRYYVPEWNRFLNADLLIDNGHDILGHNLYLYCDNNPVNMLDDNGMLPKSVVIAVNLTLYNLAKMKPGREYTATKALTWSAANSYLTGKKYTLANNNLSYYSYDEVGNLIGLNYNETQYYYIKNGQRRHHWYT